MSCMLRVSGLKLDIDRLLAAVPLEPSMSYKRGEPRFRTRPKGEKHKRSGAAFVVSEADFDRFEKQKEDAMAFLRTKRTTIRKIMKWPGIDGGGLDFGIRRRDVVAQYDVFPAELVRLAGQLGLSLELSQYPLRAQGSLKQRRR